VEVLLAEEDEGDVGITDEGDSKIGTVFAVVDDTGGEKDKLEESVVLRVDVESVGRTSEDEYVRDCEEMDETEVARLSVGEFGGDTEGRASVVVSVGARAEESDV
jgi:hypothetical protein